MLFMQCALTGGSKKIFFNKVYLILIKPKHIKCVSLDMVPFVEVFYVIKTIKKSLQELKKLRSSFQKLQSSNFENPLFNAFDFFEMDSILFITYWPECFE